MRRRLRIVATVVIGLPVALVALLMAWGVADMDTNPPFRSVTDGPPKRFFDAQADEVLYGDAVSAFVHLDEPPGTPFVVVNDTLYLSQWPYVSWRIEAIGQPGWTTDHIRRLRDAHPELEPYWPDPDRPDGGVQWVIDNDVPERPTSPVPWTPGG